MSVPCDFDVAMYMWLLLSVHRINRWWETTITVQISQRNADTGTSVQYHTVKSFNFLGTKFRGLTTMDMLVNPCIKYY